MDVAGLCCDCARPSGAVSIVIIGREFDLFPYRNLWNQNLVLAGLRWSNWDRANRVKSAPPLWHVFSDFPEGMPPEARNEQMLSLPAACAVAS